MKKKLLSLGIILVSALTFTACNDDYDCEDVQPSVSNSDADVQPSVSNSDVYVSCAGNWNANDGTVGILDYDLNKRPTAPYVFSNAYKSQNEIGIGDAQDLIVFGNKIIVTSTTSSKVEVLNRQGKKELTIKLHNVSPRYLTKDGNFVYFSAYNGKVYKMDPNNTQKPLVDSVEVGDHPEALSVANGKLYTNISGYGKGSTIAVVDCNSFKKTKTLTVGLNPYSQNIAVDNDVYFVSMFDHKTALVQKINAKNDKVTNLFKASSIAYSAKKNALVCLYATYYDKNKRFFIHDLATGKETELDMTDLKSPQQVNVDHYGNIYVIDNPSYTAPSEVFYYSPEGKLIQGHIQVGYSAQNVRFAN